MKRGLALGLASVSVISSFVTAARANDAPPFSRVVLLLPACTEPGLRSDELRDAVALDLRDEGLSLAPKGELSLETDVLVRVETSCAPDDDPKLYAEFGEEHHTRRVELSGLPSAQRARALSLALAELLSLFSRRTSQTLSEPDSSDVPNVTAAVRATAGDAADSETPAAAASAPQPKPTTPPATATSFAAGRTVSDERPPRSPQGAASGWRLSLSPELRWFSGSVLWGGRGLVHRGRWSAGIDLLVAETQVAQGTVRTVVAHGTFAYGWLLVGGPETTTLELVPRVGAGRAFLEAFASNGASAVSAQDVYFDAALGANCSFGVARLFRVGLTAELGYASGPIGYADDTEVARVSGTFVALLVGAGLRL